MLTAVSMSLAGAIFAGRIAYRLTAAESDRAAGSDRAAESARRYPAIIAAVFAGASVLGIQDYFHYILSAQSDPMLVTVCLAAIDCHLSGRHRWAWWLLALASLGRPEVWPFAAVYAIWPGSRSRRCAGCCSPARSATHSSGSASGDHQRSPEHRRPAGAQVPRELHSNKITGTFDRYTALDYLPVELAALVALGWRCCAATGSC